MFPNLPLPLITWKATYQKKTFVFYPIQTYTFTQNNQKKAKIRKNQY